MKNRGGSGVVVATGVATRGGGGATKEAVRLTARTIAALKPGAAPYRVPDLVTPGLAVRVATSGLMTWDLAFRIKGGGVKRRSLGRVESVGLEAARSRAREIIGAAREGRDLAAEADAERQRIAAEPTVADLIETYCRKMVRGRLRTAHEIEARLKRALDRLMRRKARDLRRRDMRAAFDLAADAGHPREAEKRRQVVGAMMKWALAQDLIEADPCAGLLSYGSGEPRERVLNAEEIAVLWVWLSDPSTGLPDGHASIMRLQLLLGARVGEIGGMTAEEVDQRSEPWVWTLPAARSKNGRERRTPLIGAAREIVAERLPCRGALFRTMNGGPVEATHVGNAISGRRRALPVEKFGTHDLRRTVASGMAEVGISLDVIASVVGHEPGAKETRTLVRHYLRSDLLDVKSGALRAWEARLLGIVEGRAGGNVVPLRKG